MCLTARQACSVESAAWMNPDLPVRVYQHDRPIGRPSGLHPSLGGERRQDFSTPATRSSTSYEPHEANGNH